MSKMKFYKYVYPHSNFKLPYFYHVMLSPKRRKKLSMHHFSNASSNSSNNLNTSKYNLNAIIKVASDSLFPFLYKSVNALTSLVNITLSKSHSTKDLQKNEVNSKENVSVTVRSSEPANFDTLSHGNSFSMQTSKQNENTNLEQVFFDLLKSGEIKNESKVSKQPHSEKKVITISKLSLEHRSRFLVQALSEATSSNSQLFRLEEIAKHLLLYPEQKTMLYKTGLVRAVLSLKYKTSDLTIQEQAANVLSLVGIHEPPRGQGMRILSIDGGGTRGIIAIEILRQLEAKTQKRVYELFDFMCGVSSGAILCLLLGGLRLSLDECEFLYRKLSDEVFSQSTFWGTGRLILNHAYYDTTTWVNVLRKTFGEKLLIETAKNDSSPKLAVISAVMNLPNLQAYVFRNYDFSPRIQSHYLGSCKYRMWEAIRASGAAPGYFEEYCLDEYLHQDGGILVNNPTALAIHEARLVWPNEVIQCVVSLGTGRYIPSVQPNFTSTSLKTKILKIINSATDTEAVHIGLNDLLSPHTYFRINPYLTEFLTLDENRPEKLDQMKTDAQMYLRRNEYKFSNIIQTLCLERNYTKRLRDWLKIQSLLYI